MRHEIEISTYNMKVKDSIKLLPNYDSEGNRIANFIQIFYLFYQDETEKYYFFDCEEDPIPENLKLELFNTRYLNKICICNALLKRGGEDQPTPILLNVRYDFLMFAHEHIKNYSDITEMPWIKVSQPLTNISLGVMEYELLEEEEMFDTEEKMFDYITNKMVNQTKLLNKYKWNSYGDDLTKFFKSAPGLQEFGNIFRQKKIKNFFNKIKKEN